jgi:hypothetical protein
MPQARGVLVDVSRSNCGSSAWDSDKAGRVAPVYDVIHSGGPPLPARRVLFAVTWAVAIVRPVARQSMKYVTTSAQSHLGEVAQTSRRM